MDVGLSPEQRAFAASAGALAAALAASWSQGHGPSGASSPASGDEQWARVADAGWLAVRPDEAAGGAGGSCVDVCVLVEQLGRHMPAVPVLGAILAMEQLRVRDAGPEVVEPLISGEQRFAPAFTHDLLDFASDPGDAVALDTAGVAAALVLGDDPVACSLAPGRPTADLTREAADLASPVSPVPVCGRTPEVRARELSFALTVICADLLGVASTAVERAIAHAKVREQFGRPIGSFQAIQHLLAEAHVSVEAMRSAVWYAAWAVDSLPATDALRVARTAKAFASAHAVEAVEVVIQTFGGIAMTWESPVHLWERRVHLDRRLLGDEFHQYRVLATEEAGA